MVERFEQGTSLTAGENIGPGQADVPRTNSSVFSAILDLGVAKSESQLTGLLYRIAGSFGYSYFSYSGLFAIDSHDSLAKILSSRPMPRDSSDDVHGQLLRVLSGCSRGRLTPFVWSETHRDPYITAAGQELHEAARRLRFDDGISYPVHDSMGNSGVLSFASETRCLTSSDRHRLLADGLLTAAFTHNAIRGLINKNSKVLEKPLTERETECLRLIAIGKSTGEMSRILGLSQHGVLHHVRSLMSKFGVHQRYQAVIRATACGLL